MASYSSRNGMGEARNENKPKVLIVDDSAMNRCMLEDILEDEFDIIQSENGLEAVAELKKNAADISLVLLDMVMPEMDGFDVLAVMNKYHWIESIPVIMISVENSANYIEHAYDLGVTDYIRRPFNAIAVRRRVQNTIMLYSNQKKLIGLVADQLYENEKSNNMMISILSHIVEFRNGESGMHVLHIHTITEMLLNRLAQKDPSLHLTYADISLISTASALHDIGKISIPENILNKPGRLTPEEFAVMKTHSAIGAAMIDDLPFGHDEPLIKAAYEICRWHHERYDGRGYPDGLKGDEIPLSAQIVSIADVYDALTSERVYKKAFSHEKAMEMILGGECGTFNQKLLDCLGDIAGALRNEINSVATVNRTRLEMQKATEKMLRKNEIPVAGQNITMLESERIKNQFFSSVSNSILFEYMDTPPILTLSEYGTKRLGLSETVPDPIHHESVLAISPENGKYIDRMSELVLASTPEQPVFQYDCEIIMEGCPVKCRIICRSMWNNDPQPKCTGIIGKVIENPDDSTGRTSFQNISIYDPLTGLLNRYSAKKHINEMLSQNSSDKYAMVLVDLYRIENNKLSGTASKESILKFAAIRLEKKASPTDIVARMGGDRFMIFTRYEDSFPASRLDDFVKALNKDSDDFDLSVLIGVATTEEVSRDYEVLLRCAALALDKARQSGDEPYVIYNSGIKKDK